jgi:hypothetical protein
MFNQNTGRSGESSAEILQKAAAKARESNVGTYTIAVKADGAVREVNDENELNRVIAQSGSVVYHGILIDGKGGIIV